MSKSFQDEIYMPYLPHLPNPVNLLGALISGFSVKFGKLDRPAMFYFGKILMSFKDFSMPPCSVILSTFKERSKTICHA